MSWITRRIVSRTRGRGWSWSFNEGGHWLTVSLWHRQLGVNYGRLYSGLRIWVAPRIGEYFQISFAILFRVPYGRWDDVSDN